MLPGMGQQQSSGFINELLGAGEAQQTPPNTQPRGGAPKAQDPVEEMRNHILQMLMQISEAGGIEPGELRRILLQIRQMDEQDLRMFYRSFMEGFEDKGTPETGMPQPETTEQPGFVSGLLGK